MVEMYQRKRKEKTSCTVLEICPLSVQVCPRAGVGNLRSTTRTHPAKQNHPTRSSFTNCQYPCDPPSGATFYDSDLPATFCITFLRHWSCKTALC